MADLRDSEHAVEAILFDKDGTLADARPFLRHLAMARAKACADGLANDNSGQKADLYRALCRAFGVTPEGLDPDGLMAVAPREANEQAALELVVAAGGSEEPARVLIPQIFAKVEGAITSKAAETPPFPGTQAMLGKLNNGSIKVGVLSSDRTSHVADFLQYYGYDVLVDDWRGTEAGDLPKPDPQLFWELCHRMQVSPHRTLMVGDSWTDLAVARNAEAAGFVSVSQKWGRSPLPGADYVMQDWDHLLALVNCGETPNSVTPSC